MNEVEEAARVLWRRKWRILALVAFVTSLAVVVSLLMTPRFTARAQVMIDTRRANIVSGDEVLTDTLLDTIAEERINGEVQLLQSPDLAEQVMDRLDMFRNPEFNTSLQPPGAFDAFVGGLAQRLRAILGMAPPEPPTEQTIRQQSIRNFLQALSVSALSKSPVISVSFTSEDPVLAAKVANTLVDQYLDDQLAAKFTTAARATNWLTEKTRQLQREVAASEKAIENYRRQAGLFAGTQGPIVAQQVSEVNAQLVAARASRAEAEARLNQVSGLLRQPENIGSSVDVLRSPIVQDLIVREAEAQKRVAELADEYGDRHPRIIATRAELRDIRAKIGQEVQKVVQSLRNEVAVARAREQSLQRNIEQLQSQLSQSNEAEVQLRTLSRDAEANRALLQSFLARLEQVNAQSDPRAHQPDARIVSQARTPIEPSYPKKTFIVLLAFVGSSILAIGWAFLLEKLDPGFRSGEQLEDALGVRSLGLVPIIKSLRSQRLGPNAPAMRSPPVELAESVRSIFTAICLTVQARPCKTVLVTSSVPGEGKTTFAVYLARIRAMAGAKVVLIEADTRRPEFTRTFGLGGRPGLGEVLAGQKQLEDVITYDSATGFHVLPAGGTIFDPTERLGSPQMDAVLTRLGSEFDLLVVDGPPLCAVADARILAPKVDHVVFMVRWAKTKRAAVLQGFKYLLEADGAPVGTVLSMVDPQEHASYGFMDSSLYYRDVKAYTKVTA